MSSSEGGSLAVLSAGEAGEGEPWVGAAQASLLLPTWPTPPSLLALSQLRAQATERTTRLVPVPPTPSWALHVTSSSFLVLLQREGTREGPRACSHGQGNAGRHLAWPWRRYWRPHNWCKIEGTPGSSSRAQTCQMCRVQCLPSTHRVPTQPCKPSTATIPLPSPASTVPPGTCAWHGSTLPAQPCAAPAQLALQHCGNTEHTCLHWPRYV